MEGDFIKINEWLLPLSWLYGLGVKFRNWCFTIGLLHQHSFSTPVISVGNLTVGGCGKTPHVEYLISLLSGKYKVAVLSRGYKRRSRGYILADKDTTMLKIGDEPYQMMQKFPDIYVAVDANRVKGIKHLLFDEKTRDTDVILLDDAFQHRYVKPGLNILLVDYHRLVIYDRLLPAGRLREPLEGKERADIVIVSKCPKNLRPMDYRVLKKAMALRPYQKLFYSSITYDSLCSVYDSSSRPLSSIMPDENILIISGVASPEQIMHDLSAYSKNITTLTYPDHHQFSKKDIGKINRTFAELKGPKFAIITEKDAARMSYLYGFSFELRKNLYTLPIHIEFRLDQQNKFNEAVTKYVEKAHKTAQAMPPKQESRYRQNLLAKKEKIRKITRKIITIIGVIRSQLGKWLSMCGLEIFHYSRRLSIFWQSLAPYRAKCKEYFLKIKSKIKKIYADIRTWRIWSYRPPHK